MPRARRGGLQQAGDLLAPSGQALATVVIVGRPNVGKSTLFNRILGSRRAIVHPEPGATRDPNEAVVRWAGCEFLLVDTGGWEPKGQGLTALVARSAEDRLAQADLVLLVCEAGAVPSQEEEALARRVQRAGKALIVVANKAEGAGRALDAAGLYRLGPDVIPISALHGLGVPDLLDLVVSRLTARAGVGQAVSRPAVDLKLALVGKPNTGKSSLFNRLVGTERAMVHEKPGTTRDPVPFLARVSNAWVLFTDTAGLRKKAAGLDAVSAARTARAIKEAEVVALVVDASLPLTDQDRRIASQVAEAGRACMVLANKWDLVPGQERPRLLQAIQGELELLKYAPVLAVSALTGQGVRSVIPTALEVKRAWETRIPTAELNRVVGVAQSRHPPPGGRVLYVTQVGVAPPTFVLFSTGRLDSTYLRYLERALREAFGFLGTPMVFKVRPRRRAA